MNKQTQTHSRIAAQRARIQSYWRKASRRIKREQIHINFDFAALQNRTDLDIDVLTHWSRPMAHVRMEARHNHSL